MMKNQGFSQKNIKINKNLMNNRNMRLFLMNLTHSKFLMNNLSLSIKKKTMKMMNTLMMTMKMTKKMKGILFIIKMMKISIIILI